MQLYQNTLFFAGVFLFWYLEIKNGLIVFALTVQSVFYIQENSKYVLYSGLFRSYK